MGIPVVGIPAGNGQVFLYFEIHIIVVQCAFFMWLRCGLIHGKYKNGNIERNGIYKGPLEGRRKKNELQGGDF